MPRTNYRKALDAVQEGETIEQCAKRIGIQPTQADSVQSIPLRSCGRRAMVQVENMTFRSAAEAVRVLSREGKCPPMPDKSVNAYTILVKAGLEIKRI